MFGDVPWTAGSHGALANDVLGRFRMLLDYQAERLWLVPSDRASDRSASMTRVGLAVRLGDDGCPVVGQITDTNTSETRAALQVGDTLVAVDGRNACRAWHHEIQADLAGKIGEKKKLRVRGAGAMIDIEVPVADLFAQQP
jgi:C-terminal processing protease CtpA/Prc